MTSLLCFEVGGVLGELDTQLGATVTPFNFSAFYSGLGATASGNPSLLSYDSQGILSALAVTASILAALRAEPRKAALDKAVNARQNAYFSKYGNAASIVSTANTSYGSGSSAKPALLQNLATLASQEASLLQAAYSTDGRTGVVRNTNSALSSTTITFDSSASSGQSTSTTTPDFTTTSSSQSNLETIGAQNFDGASFFDQPPPSQGGDINVSITGTAQESFQEGSSGQTSTETGTSTASESGTQTASGQAFAEQTESIVNTDYGYRVPYIESQAQNARAQISLIDQQFALFMATLNLPNLNTVLQNELNSIDLSVYQLQVGFLNTLLFSPIAGTVTGIYKNAGDCVNPGEAVIRVEDNSSILLVASLIYQGPIRIARGATPASVVTVTTNLFDAGGPATVVSGSVIAVRNRGDDDLWDVVVQCVNPLDGSGNPTFPIGYHFDYDNTTVSIT